jgi:hypothetical protein
MTDSIEYQKTKEVFPAPSSWQQAINPIIWDGRWGVATRARNNAIL